MRRFRVYVKPLERMLDFADDATQEEIEDIVDNCIEDLLDAADGGYEEVIKQPKQNSKHKPAARGRR